MEVLTAISDQQPPLKKRCLTEDAQHPVYAASRCIVGRRAKIYTSKVELYKNLIQHRTLSDGTRYTAKELGADAENQLRFGGKRTFTQCLRMKRRNTYVDSQEEESTCVSRRFGG
jgi:hypothetical protein